MGGKERRKEATINREKETPNVGNNENEKNIKRGN